MPGPEDKPGTWQRWPAFGGDQGEHGLDPYNFQSVASFVASATGLSFNDSSWAWREKVRDHKRRRKALGDVAEHSAAGDTSWSGAQLAGSWALIALVSSKRLYDWLKSR